MSGVFCCFDVSAPETARQAAAAMGARLCRSPYDWAANAPVGTAGAVGRMGSCVLNRAPQPAVAQDGVSAWLTGEFYHLDGSLGVRGTSDDPAVVLAAFALGGARAIAALSGAFVACIWDPRDETLWIVNDRYGLYPHYVAAGDGWLAVAPEVFAVLAAPRVSRTPDRVALAQYIRYQQVLGHRTWCEEVRLLPPASIHGFNARSGRLSVDQYWDWDRISRNDGVQFDEAVEESSRRFDRAVRAMTSPGARPGVYLSGGLDGRLILAFTPAEVPLATITYGAPGCRDVVLGGRLARVAGRPNTYCPLEGGHWIRAHAERHFQLTEGFHSWMHAHGMSTLDTARSLMDVNLSGWDGATLFGGYIVHEDVRADDYYRRAPTEQELQARLHEAFARRIVWPGLTDDEAQRMFASPGEAGLASAARASLEHEFARTMHYPPDRRSDYFYIQQHVRRSTGSMVVFTRSAVEVRAPYFDYALVEFLYSLPPAVRTDPRLRRAVLTARAPSLAWVPRDGDLRLPHSNPLVYGARDLFVRARYRMNRWFNLRIGEPPSLYVDYEELLRTDLRDWADRLVEDAVETLEGIVDPDAVRALWRRHLAGDELWTIGKIAPLMTLAMVRRRYH